MIYEKGGELLKSAEVRMVLGDSLLDAEKVEDAIEEYSQALQIREKLIPEDRLVADCHYMMGLAYQLGDSSEESLKHFSSARDIFEKLMESSKDNEEKYKEFSEIFEEINLKINEEKTIGVKEINLNEGKQIDTD